MTTFRKTLSTWSAGSRKPSPRPKSWRRTLDLTHAPRLEDCINARCPWSGDPVSADALTVYRGKVVGFCNPGCRDKFDAAAHSFDAEIEGKH